MLNSLWDLIRKKPELTLTLIVLPIIKFLYKYKEEKTNKFIGSLEMAEAIYYDKELKTKPKFFQDGHLFKMREFQRLNYAFFMKAIDSGCSYHDLANINKALSSFVFLKLDKKDAVIRPSSSFSAWQIKHNHLSFWLSLVLILMLWLAVSSLASIANSIYAKAMFFTGFIIFYIVYLFWVDKLGFTARVCKNFETNYASLIHTRKEPTVEE